jgi:hypothetical protein
LVRAEQAYRQPLEMLAALHPLALLLQATAAAAALQQLAAAVREALQPAVT